LRAGGGGMKAIHETKRRRLWILVVIKNYLKISRPILVGVGGSCVGCLCLKNDFGKNL